MPLKQKKVVLTGGTGGIGTLVAEELRAAQANVVIVDRSETRSSDSMQIRGDLSTMDGISHVAATLALWSPDILINLAGTQFFGPLEDQTPDDIRSTYMINLVAPAMLAQAVVPSMKRRGSGHIVNIGSIFGSINYPHFATYSSAKAGLRGLSEALRRELSGTGIDITYIAPRAVRTGLSSGKVGRFVEMANMQLDEPGAVARRIVRAIQTRKKELFIGLPERLFVSLNAVAPRLVDAGLTAQTAKARTLFNS